MSSDGAPLMVVGVHVLDVKRHARVPTMTVHWAVEGQFDCSAFEAEESRPTVLRRFKRHMKAQAINLEPLRIC